MKLVLDTDKILKQERAATRALRTEIAKCPPGGSYGGLTKKEALKVANAMAKVFGPRQSITVVEGETYRVGRKADLGGKQQQAARGLGLQGAEAGLLDAGSVGSAAGSSSGKPE